MLQKITKKQWITLIGVMLYLIYEYIILRDWKLYTSGPLIRIDLLLFYPLIAIGAILSLVDLTKQHLPSAMLLIGLIFGGGIVGYTSLQFIENKYDTGVQTGYTNAGITIAHFLDNHLKGKEQEDLHIKYLTIQPYEQDGIRTFKIIGLDSEE